MRRRIFSTSSVGSMWMSEAWASAARPIRALTARTTGASLERSRRRSTSASSTPPASPAQVVGRIEPVERRLHVAGAGDQGNHRPLQGEGQGVGAEGRQGIDESHLDPGVGLPQGQGPRVAQEPRRQPLGRHRFLGEIRRGGDAQAGRLGDRLGQGPLGDQAQAGQHGIQGLAGLALDQLGARQSLGRRQAAFENQAAKIE